MVTTFSAWPAVPPVRRARRLVERDLAPVELLDQADQDGRVRRQLDEQVGAVTLPRLTIVAVHEGRPPRVRQDRDAVLTPLCAVHLAVPSGVGSTGSLVSTAATPTDMGDQPFAAIHTGHAEPRPTSTLKEATCR